MAHPDDTHHLHDWPIYGPRNANIADLVEKIANAGFRLSVIEDRIEAMLTDWLAEISPNDPKEHTNG